MRYDSDRTKPFTNEFKGGEKSMNHFIQR